MAQIALKAMLQFDSLSMSLHVHYLALFLHFSSLALCLLITVFAQAILCIHSFVKLIHGRFVRGIELQYNTQSQCETTATNEQKKLLQLSTNHLI